MKTIVNENSQVYYSGDYWNNLPRVREYMCENFTGDKSKWWVQDFQERFAQPPFEHGLFLNCGNGWVEREFVDKGIVKQATAFDYSTDLLQEAERKRGDRPIIYFQTDANKIEFGESQFDLAVNVAALHHVQYINRLCRILCKALKENGVLVSFDYIGPHRNQYSLWHWLKISRANNTLPRHIRKEPLRYPHIPSMLHYDPTEAIHSELIVRTISMYFEIFERHDTGGGIAYEILTHNTKLKNIPSDELNPWIDILLMLDKKYTETNQIPPLFSYFIAKPHKLVLQDQGRMKHLDAIEDRREKWAGRHRGTYTYYQYLKMLTHSIYVKLVNSRMAQRLQARSS